MRPPAAPRIVPFERVVNFRDLGGYPSLWGGEVRWGRVYRSAALHEMSGDDVEHLRALGIVTVYDLRSEREHTDHPDPVPSISVPVLGRYAAAHDEPDFASMVEHDHGAAFMSGLMINMLRWGAEEIGSVISGLADEECTPAVFHCTAGKDRAGIVAAVLLEVLGVERELVLDDFHLSDAARGPIEGSPAFVRMLSMGMPPEAAAGALGAPREMLAGVLEQLDTEYGSAEKFLVGEGGVRPATIDRLRASLLT